MLAFCSESLQAECLIPSLNGAIGIRQHQQRPIFLARTPRQLVGPCLKEPERWVLGKTYRGSQAFSTHDQARHRWLGEGVGKLQVPSSITTYFLFWEAGGFCLLLRAECLLPSLNKPVGHWLTQQRPFFIFPPPSDSRAYLGLSPVQPASCVTGKTLK